MAAVICEKCSKEVRPGKRGSMTQWVFDDSSCSCHKASLNVAQEETKNKICPKCFNFKTSRRSGSMTQWIFRRYQCNCADEPTGQSEKEVRQPTSKLSEFAGEPQPEEDFGNTEFPFNIERYKPLSLIAKSMNSVVYKCLDRQLGRIVAIKTLMFIDSAALINFQQEARATGHLKHPNIVEVLDFGIGDGGAAYMILEFVESIDLDDWVTKKGAVEETDAIAVIGEVCRALDFAHRKGIFHRDLKPQNILITANREVKLIDFGLALVVNPEKNISDTKGLSLAGTPSYMSPDQFLGRPYDALSEIYSLGCVLFFCLTGRPPFFGETALDIARAHADMPVPTLEEEACPGRQFSERVRHVVERCLQKDASLRYSSISSLANDLKVELNQPQSDNIKQSASIFVSNDGLQQLISDHPDKTTWQKFNSALKKNALPIFFSVFALAVLTTAAAVVIFSRTEEESVRFPEFHSTVMNTPVEKDPILLQNDNKTLSTLDDKLSSQYTAYKGKRADYSALLGEADQSIRGEHPSNSELYFSLDSYNECIGKLTRDGPLKPPDRVMTRALLGSYKANLKLRKYDELPGLERKILQYCPSGGQAELAYHIFMDAATSCTKRKKPREAIRCLEAALEAWKKTENQQPYTGLELNIGTTYLELGEWKKAKQWLDPTLEHIEKSAPNRDFNIACLIRLAVANQKLKDYKTAYAKFRAAEQMVLKPRDQFSDQYIGQLYYRWAIALHEEGKLEEAESKLLKGIAGERETRSQLALQSYLGTIRKELGSETKRK